MEIESKGDERAARTLSTAVSTGLQVSGVEHEPDWELSMPLPGGLGRREGLSRRPALAQSMPLDRGV